MIRFFTNPENIDNKRIKLSDEDRYHMRSLRLKPNEEFIVCDGTGTDYVCKLCAGAEETTAEILRQEQSRGEPSIDCTIYLAYAKGDRLDYAVQKAVELGAKEIVLFKSKRCIATPDNVAKKLKRLHKISHEAAKQCGRGIIPTVKNIEQYSEIIDIAAKESTLSILLYEDESTLHLKQVLEQHFDFHSGADRTRSPTSGITNNKQTISIISGPEGGFEIGEAEAARESGIYAVSIGQRILRSETAPIAALSALMYHTNNLQRHGYSNEDSISS
ncbi:MAG: 16S rRNA (uracil(1498)-N(3))-methyltransferase [Oscillospiraceae bacterium]|nr:16S rRNA (uracil(1498)-N(3))-methyltransferase [Oscillospiraceae bacterium]MCL2278492.1 16S rRNA (uracil(1498)-N(3))-methyltransferase [Oscillospiraceae bacterium]